MFDNLKKKKKKQRLSKLKKKIYFLRNELYQYTDHENKKKKNYAKHGS